MTVNDLEDVFDLPNGAIIKASFLDNRFMKIRTKKDRYGNAVGILVLDCKTDEKYQLRSLHKEKLVQTDPNPVTFAGKGHDPSEITHVHTDKTRVKAYYAKQRQ